MKRRITAAASGLAILLAAFVVAAAAPRMTPAGASELPGMCSGRTDPGLVVVAYADGHTDQVPSFKLSVVTDASGHASGMLVLDRGSDRLLVQDFCRVWQHPVDQTTGGNCGEPYPAGAVTAHAVGLTQYGGQLTLVRADVRKLADGTMKYRVRWKAASADEGEMSAAAEEDSCEGDWTRVPAEGWLPLDGMNVYTGVSSLTVEKRQNTTGGPGSLIGGASFRITPNPVPGQVNPDLPGRGYLDVTDNAAPDVDPADGVVRIDPAIPGSYTVQELSAPDGYLVDSAEPVAVDAPVAGNAKTVTFVDTKIVTSLGLTKTVKESYFAAAGDAVHYDYRLTNDSNVPLTPPFAVTDDSGAAVTCPTAPASLAPGKTVDCTATYDVTAADAAAGSLHHSATAEARYRDRTVTSMSAVTTVPLAAVALSLAVDRAQAEYGDTLTYTMTVANTGGIRLSDVTISDVLPPGTAYLSGGDRYTADTRTVMWTIGDVAAGATVAPLELRVRIEGDRTGPLPAVTISNIAHVASAEAVPGVSNDVATQVVAVLGEKVERPTQPAQQPGVIPAAVLPTTGPPVPIPALVVAALAALGVGATLVAAGARGTGRGKRRQRWPAS